MFARLTTFNMKADRVDEAIEFYQDNVVPMAKTQKGYCGIYLFTDHRTNKAIALSLWDSKEDSITNEQGYYQEQVGKFAQFFATSPIREGYEVSVQG